MSMGGIGHPLVSDFYPHGKISQSLGIFNDQTGFPARSVTILDPQGVVRGFHTYPAGTLPIASDILAELTELQKK